jgi:hypothetical protein
MNIVLQCAVIAGIGAFFDGVPTPTAKPPS